MDPQIPDLSPLSSCEYPHNLEWLMVRVRFAEAMIPRLTSPKHDSVILGLKQDIDRCLGIIADHTIDDNGDDF